MSVLIIRTRAVAEVQLDSTKSPLRSSPAAWRSWRGKRQFCPQQLRSTNRPLSWSLPPRLLAENWGRPVRCSHRCTWPHTLQEQVKKQAWISKSQTVVFIHYQSTDWTHSWPFIHPHWRTTSGHTLNCLRNDKNLKKQTINLIRLMKYFKITTLQNSSFFSFTV